MLAAMMYFKQAIRRSFMPATYLRSLAMMGSLIVVIAGCGSQTRVDTLYHDRAADTLPYQQLLVIGIAGDASVRRRIEELITANLADENVAAIAGYTRLGTSTVLLQDAIDAAAASTQSDGILIVHLASTSVTGEVREGRVDVELECRGGSPVDLFLYDRRELREPDSVTLAHEVTMVTNLYDSGSSKRIWTIQSTCFDKTDFDTVLRQEARAIVQQLLRDALVTVSAG